MNCSENNNKQLMTGEERKDKEQSIVRHARRHTHTYVGTCGMAMMQRFSTVS